MCSFIDNPAYSLRKCHSDGISNTTEQYWDYCNDFLLLLFLV